ncbi:putative endo-1,3(4)-beta-glucanase [Trifolium repens]|nr:putative endo-1,3(4)-beta-glucanase [Trifolium repens]
MELVEWTLPALKRKDIGEEMKGFVFALQAIYDKEVEVEVWRQWMVYDIFNIIENHGEIKKTSQRTASSMNWPKGAKAQEVAKIMDLRIA